MDNWKKYMAENKDKLSIEEVDEKVWEHVSKTGIPKKRSLMQVMQIAFDGLFQTKGSQKEAYSSKRRNHTFKLAFASVFFAFIIVSCTYKVKSYATYGDLVSFALAKNSYLLNNEFLSKNLLHSFSRVVSPSDSSSFLFFQYFKKNNPEAKTIIGNIKKTEGVSELVVTPVVFEYKESLFSSWVSKAFDIQLKTAKPDNKQIKNTIKGLLKEKGLHKVDVQIEEHSQDILLISKTETPQLPLPVAKDLLTITNAGTDSIKVTSKTDTIKPKRDLRLEMPPLNLPGWKKDLALRTEFTNALEKDGLIDNKKPYKIEVKDGEFYIDDKEQTKEVNDKYRKYLRNDNYTITNDGDEPKSTSDHSETLKDKRKTGLPKPNIDAPKFDPIQYQKELKLMNQLINGLHEDGLIDRKKPYTVQVREGELYINNKKQPKEVTDKFRKYFQSDNYGFMND